MLTSTQIHNKILTVLTKTDNVVFEVFLTIYVLKVATITDWIKVAILIWFFSKTLIFFTHLGICKKNQ